MLGFVTDRTQQNVARRKELTRRGWASMTTAERDEWTGNPLSVTGANLIPTGPHYSSTVDLEFGLTDIVATAKSAGTYLYAILIIGETANYENKTFTLSVDAIESTSGVVPQIALYWHDDAGYEYAGAALFNAGSATINTAEWPNYNSRANLALYIYVTTTEEAAVGAQARFKKVMFVHGEEKHDYSVYNEIAPTPATKGAYNFSDLNRVERAVAEISSLENLKLTTKTNWGMWDVPTVSDMNRYLSNVKAIRTYAESSIELPDTMDNLTYTYANNIERVIEAGLSRASVG